MAAQCSSVRVVVVPAAITRRPSRLGAHNRVGGVGGQGVVLGVQMDLVQPLHAQRLKRSEADVQRHVAHSRRQAR